MAKIDQLIEDIREMKNETTRRSAHRIFNMLEGHKREFSGKIDSDYLELALKTFEALSEASAGESQTEDYKREFKKSYEGLLFHLNRIL
ncbi:MAG: hypothetical protein JNL60_13270 [Bacteroidia bacterium]|nr:hypothetical protein [Bacteroidia bacterium]